jgi:propanol-preferring alcohol dehydrogenase
MEDIVVILAKGRKTKSVMMMKAARIVKPKQSLEIQEIDTPKPKGSQVLVKVQSSGVCHSDIHLWEGGYEGPGGEFLKTTDRGVKYPLTPGHEIAGIVEGISDDEVQQQQQQ